MLSPDERAVLREGHGCYSASEWCRGCGKGFPCPTVRALDALEEMEQVLHEMYDQAHVDSLHFEINRLVGEASRSAEHAETAERAHGALVTSTEASIAILRNEVMTLRGQRNGAERACEVAERALALAQPVLDAALAWCNTAGWALGAPEVGDALVAAMETYADAVAHAAPPAAEPAS